MYNVDGHKPYGTAKKLYAAAVVLLVATAVARLALGF